MFPKDWMNHINELPNDIRLTRTSMTEDEFELEEIWKCAFPDGLNHDQVLQLIYLMYKVDDEKYPSSMRSVAHDVGVLLGVYYVNVLNEVYGVNEIVPDDQFQKYLKDRMEKCGYYEWLADDGYPTIEAETIQELYPILVEKRPCKRITLVRQSINFAIEDDVAGIINSFIRSRLSLSETWQGLKWNEHDNMTTWDIMMRAISEDSNRKNRYMDKKEAHMLVGKITKVLNDHERLARNFTNYQANNIWYPITDASWQYWFVTVNTRDIGIFGVEE